MDLFFLSFFCSILYRTHYREKTICERTEKNLYTYVKRTEREEDDSDEALTCTYNLLYFLASLGLVQPFSSLYVFPGLFPSRFMLISKLFWIFLSHLFTIYILSLFVK